MKPLTRVSPAFACRLFSVLRYESVIHEFDPYFNFRSTKYLVNEGIYNFLNWFDESAWYPLGRIVGGTVYPGKFAMRSQHEHGTEVRFRSYDYCCYRFLGVELLQHYCQHQKRLRLVGSMVCFQYCHGCLLHDQGGQEP